MSNINAIFGIHSITPYDLSNGKPLSKKPFDVVGNFNASMTQEQIEQIGGSSFDAQDIELGVRAFEGTMLVKDMPSALIEIATGSKPAENAAEASGSVTSLLNVLNTSLQDAVAGIASIGLKSGSTIDVAKVNFTVEVISPTTVDVYAHSDVDFQQGASKVFQAGSHKITASPLTILTAGAATEIPGFGVELIGGSGTIDMTIGDTAVFNSRPANSFSRTVNIGDPLVKPKKIGIFAEAQRKSDGSMVTLNMYSALIGGLPLGLTEKAYNEGEYTFKVSRAIDIFTGNEGLYSMDQVVSNGLC